MNKIIIPKDYKPDSEIIKLVEEFLKSFRISEIENGIPILLMMDEKSQAYYIVCHLEASALASKTDTDAVLDPTESEEYKLNRDIYTDNYAYRKMEGDASKGRSFEDIVVEYDITYRPILPLKVFGGQHRVEAIKHVVKSQGHRLHGVRVYFGLSTDQKIDIAIANNTSIAVSNDLLDRMQEELLGSELRDWCQSVGLLDDGQNFADRRSPDGIPTVRVARTIVVNFFKAKGKKIDDQHDPVVCATGASIDEEYKDLRTRIDWKDKPFKKMGVEFAKLHKLQKERVMNRTIDKHVEFATKAIHPCVVSTWAYAAGLFQNDPRIIAAHYGLPDSVTSNKNEDPLNAKSLSTARLKGTDPDTYRGLAARINNEELGRMLEVFLLHATRAKKRGINSELANAAIKSYHAKKAKDLADKAMKRI